MTTRRLSIVQKLAILGGLLPLMLLTAEPAAAQPGGPSPSELRRENEALRQRVEQLEAELNRANETVSELRDQVEDMASELEAMRLEMRRLAERSGAAGGADEPAPEVEEPSYAPLPEGEPMSSPAAMLAYMQQTYEEQLSETPFESEAELRRYMSELNNWARMMRLELRDQVEWVIVPTEVLEASDRRVTLMYQVVDPNTLLPYDERSYELVLTSASAVRRFNENAEHGLWLIRGRASAEPTINRDRENEGFFDIPPFIGPFAEFGFELDVEAFLRVAAPEMLEELEAERRRRATEREDGEETGATGSGAEGK